MKITFLGTGTSSGVPMIGCSCEVCTSNDSRDIRLRSSILISTETENFAIDCGPDFRQQMLANKIAQLHGIVYTHEHHDHTAGLDDIRGYNYFMDSPMNLYLTTRVEQAIRKEFAYIFAEHKYPGIPEVKIINIENNIDFRMGSLQVTPIEVMHYKLPVLGFRINDFTYITDANFISDVELKKINGTKILVLNALRKEKHISHFALDEAIALSKKIGAQKTYFTHISHQLGLHSKVEMQLPKNIYLGYDGLIIEA
jgi:phosphoribosyl 1,2-cyclic phosphate phosphodiesterase